MKGKAIVTVANGEFCNFSCQYAKADEELENVINCKLFDEVLIRSKEAPYYQAKKCQSCIDIEPIE